MLNISQLLGQRRRPPYLTPGIGDDLILRQYEEETRNPNEIVVTAAQDRPSAATPDYNDRPVRESIDPRYVLNDDRIAPTEDELEEILPRRGMFGVKGTLRDVLGTLGDAFLVQSGGKPVYAPRRDQERAGDAMFGAAQDPYQAAERLAALGYVEEAQNLIEQAQRNEYQQGNLASVEGARQDQARNRQRDDVRVGRNQVARWMQAAGDNPNRIAHVYALTDKLARELGVGLEDLGLTAPNLSSDQRAVIAGGDMTVNQQEQLPRRDRQLDISQQNADSARINATRPRNPPPRPRADTDQEYYREISQVPENERTAEEKAWVTMYINGRGRSGGNGRRSVNPGTSSRTEGWTVKRN
jgi:hypothetical protein